MGEIEDYKIITQERLEAQQEFQDVLTRYFHELSELIGNGGGNVLSAENAAAEAVEPIES